MRVSVRKFVENRVYEEGLRNSIPVLAIIDHIETVLDRDLTVDEIKLMGSSGSSVVVIVDNIPFAFQHYSFPGNYKRVHEFVSAMERNPEINFDLTVSSGFGRRAQRAIVPISYNMFDYLVRAEKWLPKIQTVVWELIDTMHSVDEEYILENKNKILWNLGKSLEGIHQNRFVHGDATLDNAGQKEGNFIYFDFDSSKKIKPGVEVNPADDFRSLIQSLEFHLDTKLNLHPRNFLANLVLQIKREKGFESFEEAVEYLEEL